MKLSKRNIYIGIGLLASVGGIIYIINRRKKNEKIIQSYKFNKILVSNINILYNK